MKNSILIWFILICLAFCLLVFAKQLVIKTKEVKFQSGEVQLVGTLAMPRLKKAPFPTVVIVHGSGTDTRKKHRGYWRLISQGLAVLTYDKRGIGESGGTYQSLSMANAEHLLQTLANDAAAAVDFLKKQPQIDINRIGLLGGSQAGWVMPLAAHQNKSISFLVSISGPAVTFGQEDYYSQLTGDSPGPFSGLTENQIDSMLDTYNGPSGYDPRPILEQINIPSFWLLGEKDRSVPTRKSVEVLNEINGPGKSLKIKVYPRGEHSIKDYQTGRRINYWKDIYLWLSEIKII